MAHAHHGFRLPCAKSLETLDDVVRAVASENINPASWDAISSTATLVMTRDGAPIRTIITGRRKLTTGSYASRKAGRALPYESMIERAFFMHSEVDTNVVDYRAQPFRFEFVIDDRKRTYVVDCIRLLADGSIEIVEVKKDARALRNPDYALKLEAVRLVCERVGWRFRIVFEAALVNPPHVFRNIIEVQSWGLTEFGAADEFRVVGALHERGRMALGALADVMGERLASTAKLKAMMVARIVRLDLSRVLTPDTPVELVLQDAGSFQ